MDESRPAGLFLNCARANDSIFESGKMAYDCLKDSQIYSLDYVEIDGANRTVSTDYDFYFFNYHNHTMSWLDTRAVRGLLPGVKMTMVLEVSPNDPFVYCPPDDFDLYCVLDPTLTPDRPNVYSFPRPLETFTGEAVYTPGQMPVIGSFGFATPGKGFEHLVDAVNREFDQAIVRINIPFGTYTDDGGKYARYLAEACKAKAHDGIEVEVTHDFMVKDELIRWCAKNTINCFLYDRDMQGLAATTDQAVSSGRPLLVSKNNTFRHVQRYIKPFPYQGLKEAIEAIPAGVARMQEAWSPAKFRERFESVLAGCDLKAPAQKKAGTIELPVYRTDLVQSIKNKVALRTRLRRLQNAVTGQDQAVSVSKPRHARFGEDVAVADLLDELKIKNIRYLDICTHAGDAFEKTGLLYEKGFKGVLVASDRSTAEASAADRPRDTVLNAQVDGYESDIKPAADTGSRRYSINELISSYFTECPDFVSLGTGGYELQILQSIYSEIYSPAVICIEMQTRPVEGPANDELEKLLVAMGYFLYKSTPSSAIFVNKNLYDFHLYQVSEISAGN